MFKRSYEVAIRVLEDHIERQNRIIEGLLSELRGKEVRITQREEPVGSAILDDEEDLKGLIPLYNGPSPGSIINEDEM